MIKKILLIVLSSLMMTHLTTAQEVDKIDVEIKPYTKVSGISGNLNSIGSDTMNNLVTYWAEAFNRIYPAVRVQIEGKGSSTAPPALIARTAQLGPMSRDIKPTEVDAFEKRFGYKPLEIKVAVDALAIFVHMDNPLPGLSFPQVDAIFSRTRRSRYPEDIKNWEQLGLTGKWAKRPISFYGRNSASGTYGFFKERALFKGDFKSTVKEQPGSGSVVHGITEDRYGIGYSGAGYRTSSVRSVPLALKEGEPYKEASAENVLDGTYPLARFLYIYVNKIPEQPLDPLIKEFFKFALSKQGQEIVIKDGLLPLPATIIEKELDKLE
jgi:phosphate transport system substrate-binding protein